MPIVKIRGHRGRWYLWSFASLFAAVALSLVGVSLLFLYQTIRTPINQNEQFLIITPGTGTHSLATQLVSEGLAGSRWPVLAWAVLSGTSGTFKSGEFLIPQQTSPAQVCVLVIHFLHHSYLTIFLLKLLHFYLVNR